MIEHSVEIENGAFGYGSSIVVRTNTVSIGKGVTCIIGPNGSGKTTLLRGMTGVLRAMEGRVSIDSTDLFGSEGDSLRKRIGFVPENSYPYPDMTAYQYLRYWGSLYDATEKTIDYAMEKMGIRDLGAKSTNKLSLGQKKRVMIARIFLFDPIFLVMDEPTSNLDPDIALFIMTFMRERSKNIPVIYSTHHLLEAERLYDNAFFVKRGMLMGPYPKAELTEGLYSAYGKIMGESGVIS